MLNAPAGRCREHIAAEPADGSAASFTRRSALVAFDQIDQDGDRHLDSPTASVGLVTGGILRRQEMSSLRKIGTPAGAVIPSRMVLPFTAMTVIDTPVSGTTIFSQDFRLITNTTLPP